MLFKATTTMINTRIVVDTPIAGKIHGGETLESVISAPFSVFNIGVG
jgi:hypothetical protein